MNMEREREKDREREHSQDTLNISRMVDAADLYASRHFDESSHSSVSGL